MAAAQTASPQKPAMQAPHADSNPFDTAFATLRDLRMQVQQLQADLHTERAKREEEVAGLQQALSNEMAERAAAVARLKAALETEKSERDAALDRTRHDMGDLRMGIEKETNNQRATARATNESITAQVSKLEAQLTELKEGTGGKTAELSAVLQNEIQDRIVACQTMDAKFSKETASLQNDVAAVMQELRENTRVTESHHDFLGLVAKNFQTYTPGLGVKAGVTENSSRATPEGRRG
mmetsp:Transcript_41780/g.75842  ORF Transcript_41780/g.75842 Transcript_41780/m.75842 type:complete len:238 (-) Transcript_41780:76-789(-)